MPSQRRQINVRLSEADEQLLERLQDDLGIPGPVKTPARQSDVIHQALHALAMLRGLIPANTDTPSAAAPPDQPAAAKGDRAAAKKRKK